jgi:uncharacterized glyoxalase superfamily protein PhnB
MSGQFRCAYFTSRYEETLAFYRDGLELPVTSSWERSKDDRGTIFAAASGMIEVLARPQTAVENPAWDDRAPQGMMIVVEVTDIDAVYRRTTVYGFTIREALKDQTWGHRSFVVSDPNGVHLYLFESKIT